MAQYQAIGNKAAVLGFGRARRIKENLRGLQMGVYKSL
jgi:hypothetical protein